MGRSGTLYAYLNLSWVASNIPLLCQAFVLDIHCGLHSIALALIALYIYIDDDNISFDENLSAGARYVSLGQQ